MKSSPENPESSRKTGRDSPESSTSPTSPDSSAPPGSPPFPKSGKNTRPDFKKSKSQKLEDAVLEQTKSELELHTLVVVMKDYPEFNVFKGYLGLIIDFPDGDKNFCLVEFDDFTSIERNPNRHNWFYLSKNDLISYYSSPLLTFRKRLQWSSEEFLL